VAEVLDAMREQRGGRSLEAEAVEAYQRVLESGVYAPQAGLLWSPRGVREQCGRAAMEAFLAAGGHSAFASSWDESKRRERFIREYSNVVRDDPSTRLLPAAGEAPKALPGPAGYEPLTAAEAHNILRKIEDRVPAHQSRMNDETLRERVAFLRAQATELTAETETAQEGPPGPPIAAAQERVPRARGQTSWMHARTARPGRNGEA
jgi:hypothetical protein